MPADVEKCVSTMQGKVDSPWGFCTWAKEHGKGPFSHAESQNFAEALREYEESCRPAKKFSEGSACIKGCDIFMVGDHGRDETYTEDDLTEMVGNFNRFSAGPKPLLRVPAVLGHEENQEFLDRSDIPAAAWATKVYKAFDSEQRRWKLKADFCDLSPSVKRLLDGKAYRTVSAEIYPEPPQGIPGGHGKMLRRVAFLGGEIPQIKSLEDIPAPTAHAERDAQYKTLTYGHRVRLPSGAYACFSEVTRMKKYAEPMGRDDMVKQLVEMGFNPDVLQGMPEEAMQEIIRVYGGQGHEPGDDASTPSPEDNKLAERDENTPAPYESASGQQGGRSIHSGDKEETASSGRPVDQGLFEAGEGSNVPGNLNAGVHYGDDERYKQPSGPPSSGSGDWPSGYEESASGVTEPLKSPASDAGAPSGWAEDASGVTEPLHSPEQDAGAPSGWAEDYTQPSGPPSSGSGDWPEGYAEFDEEALQAMPEKDRVAKMMGHMRRYMDFANKCMGEMPPQSPEGKKLVAMMGRIKRHAEMPPERQQQQPKPPHSIPEESFEDPTMPVAPIARRAERPLPKQTTVTHKYSEPQVRQLIDQAVKDALKKYVGKSLNELHKFAEHHTAAEKKRAVNDVCDRLQKEGKLTPGERPVVQQRLYRADSRQGIQRFKERNGRVRDMTEFDLQILELERRPSCFAERFKDPVRSRGKADKPGAASEDEIERVERFHESHADAFEKAGISRVEFVETYRKSSPAERRDLLKNGDGQ